MTKVIPDNDFLHNAGIQSPVHLRVTLRIKIVILLAIAILLVFQYNRSKPETEPSMVTKEQAWERLMTGNQRFRESRVLHPHEDRRHIRDIASGQHPFAVVVTCSDSRVVPEIIFDQGMGDLFVIRTAGNVLSGIEIGSIDYAVEHLGAKLVMIMGHEDCGAIKAFIAHEDPPGHIRDIMDSLKREIEMQSIDSIDNRHINQCINANTLHGIHQLERESPLVREAIAAGKLMLAAARYDLHTQEVTQLKH